MPSISKTYPVYLINGSYSESRTCSSGVCTPLEIHDNSERTRHELDIMQRSWTRTNGYKALVAAGKRLPCQPSSRKSSLVKPNCVVWSWNRSLWADAMGNSTYAYSENRMSLRHLYSNPSWFDFVNRGVGWNAISGLLIDKIKGAEWQAPVFAVEGRKTVEMVVGTANVLSTTIYQLRRGNIAGAFKALGLAKDKKISRQYRRTYGKDPSKAAANAWLQLQYGWVPLLSDVKSAAEAFGELVTQDHLATQLRAVATLKVPYRFERVVNFSGVPIGSGTIRLQEEGTVQRRLFVLYRPTLADIPGSFGLLNPLSIAWELVPFSFVADWFIPFGDYVRHLDAPLRYQFIDGLDTHQAHVKGSAVPVTLSNPRAQWTGGPDAYELHDATAVVLKSLPTPSLTQINFDPKLGVKRMVSALALLRQQASRL